MVKRQFIVLLSPSGSLTLCFVKPELGEALTLCFVEPEQGESMSPCPEKIRDSKNSPCYPVSRTIFCPGPHQQIVL